MSTKGWSKRQNERMNQLQNENDRLKSLLQQLATICLITKHGLEDDFIKAVEAGAEIRVGIEAFSKINKEVESCGVSNIGFC